MSSAYVRTQIKSFIGTALPVENLIDLTGEYDDINDLISSAGLDPTQDWLGIEFIGGEESPVSVPATNTKGKYRELGGFMLHVVTAVQSPASVNTDNLLTRGTSVNNAFRGMRINDILIESMTQPNFESGASIEFEAGYTAATVSVSYERDLDL